MAIEYNGISINVRNRELLKLREVEIRTVGWKKKTKEKKLVRKYNSLTIIFLSDLQDKLLLLVVNTEQLKLKCITV